MVRPTSPKGMMTKLGHTPPDTQIGYFAELEGIWCSGVCRLMSSVSGMQVGVQGAAL